jgi:septum formation protein
MKSSLVLASSSIHRKRLLERLKIPFTVLSPDIDESPLPNESPQDMVLRLAKEKANVFANQFRDSFIIGVDQVGLLDNTVLCKPLTNENAIKQLQLASGKTVTFLIGLCLLDVKRQAYQVSLEIFDVKFRSLTLPMIEYYLKNEDALNCAGSLKIDGLGTLLVEKMQGNDYTALIGLPLIKVTEMLEAVNIIRY